MSEIRKHPKYQEYYLLALDALGDADLAAVTAKAWCYEPPADLEEFKRYANKAHRYETDMRGLNFDYSTENLSPEEYSKREVAIRENVYRD
ncbi:MAG: hypothetical protein ABI758_04465 [Candidatus Woesebacteria bacterium]